MHPRRPFGAMASPALAVRRQTGRSTSSLAADRRFFSAPCRHQIRDPSAGAAYPRGLVRDPGYIQGDRVIEGLLTP